MPQITKTLMLQLYLEDMLDKIVNVGNKLYARRKIAQDGGDNYDFVWCNL